MPPRRSFPAADLPYFLRGCLMGAADIIPGVSGGTVALILGIYRRVVTAVSRFDGELLALVKDREWSRAAQHVDLRFLIALGAGIGTGVLSLASLMHYLLEHERQATFSVFFGLIFASTILVSRMIQRWNGLTISIGLAAAVFAFWLVGLLPAQPPAGDAYVFFCGFIAICAMILPGISGAFILLILGKYDEITGLLRAMLHGQITSEAVVTLAVFCSGCVVGLLSFSKLLKWLLNRYESATMAVLCGFMAGSLRRIWPFQRDLTPSVLETKHKQFAAEWPDHFDGEVALCIGLAIGAALFVLILDRLTRGHEHVPTIEDSAK